MNINYTFLIAMALSLDAFGVAISIGINRALRIKNKMLFALSFGFFQFLFSLIGAYFGFFFSTYIIAIPRIMGGAIIVTVGIIMIRDGRILSGGMDKLLCLWDAKVVKCSNL